jgi:hypothetical protein
MCIFCEHHERSTSVAKFRVRAITIGDYTLKGILNKGSESRERSRESRFTVCPEGAFHRSPGQRPGARCIASVP